MSADLDQHAYKLIWRLGCHSLAQTLKLFGKLIRNQAFTKPLSPPFETEGLSKPEFADLENHPAVREYRRMIWRGWYIDYDRTPEAYPPSGHIVMKRGACRRVIAVGRVE